MKISDFGMSKQDAFYTAKTSIVPVRWSAPEVLERYTWTHKSDVFSFAVCCWEILEFGKVPWGMAVDNSQVSQMVLSGQRLPQPSNCPEDLYSLLLKCWSRRQEDRPNFEEVLLHLAQVRKSMGGETSTMIMLMSSSEVNNGTSQDAVYALSPAQNNEK